MFLKKLVGATALVSVMSFASSAADAKTIDLGFALDESGSVSLSDFNLSTSGLANALDEIPTSGPNQYRISVVIFSSSARTVVDPTVVTAGNIDSLKTTISGISKFGGGTDADRAIDLLTANFTGVGLGDESYFNLATDGFTPSNALADSAAAAVAAGIDGLSFEAVGSGASTSQLLRSCYGGSSFSDPGSGNTASGCSLVTDPNNLPDATQEGFVLTVDNFTDFQGALRSKVESIVDDTGGGGDPNVIPLPAGLPLMMAGLGAFAFLRRRSKA
ncbi:MAG: VWA domain-containing protein [Pseudomonadota bacterium]